MCVNLVNVSKLFLILVRACRLKGQPVQLYNLDLLTGGDNCNGKNNSNVTATPLKIPKILVINQQYSLIASTQ